MQIVVLSFLLISREIDQEIDQDMEITGGFDVFLGGELLRKVLEQEPWLVRPLLQKKNY